MIQSLVNYVRADQSGGTLSSSPAKHGIKRACCIWVETQHLQCSGAQAQVLKPQLFRPCPGLPFSFHCIFTFEVSNETSDWRNRALQHFKGWVFLVSIIYSVFCSFNCHVLYMEWYIHSMPTSHFKRRSQKSVSRLQAGTKKPNPNTFCMTFVTAPGYTEELRLIALLLLSSSVLQYYLTLSISGPPLA